MSSQCRQLESGSNQVRACYHNGTQGSDESRGSVKRAPFQLRPALRLGISDQCGGRFRLHPCVMHNYASLAANTITTAPELQIQLQESVESSLLSALQWAQLSVQDPMS
jgi:hypothetical protein